MTLRCRGGLSRTRALAVPLVVVVVLSAAACGEDVLVGRLGDDPASADDAGGAPGFSGGRDATVAFDGCAGETCAAADGGPAPSPACAGKACGDRCSTCPGPSCPAVIESCDALGRCGLDVPVCDALDAGAAYAPCAAKRCGDPCTLCRPGDVGCVETADLKFCQPDLSTCRSAVPACGP